MAVRVKSQGLLWDDNEPTMRRIDDNDVYKILMLYLIWKEFPNLRVTFGFKNRTVNVPIGTYLSAEAFQEELDAYCDLRFTEEVVAPFRSWMMFEPDFLEWLQTLQPARAKVTLVEDQLAVTVSGRWTEATLIEIAALCIASEKGGQGFAAVHEISEQALYDEGNRRLTDKIQLMNQHPDLRIAEFGTRRRASFLWQQHVVGRLKTELRPGILTGTSNMLLADQFDLEAIGTNAHELPMGLAALAAHISDEAIRESAFRVLEIWKELYGYKSLIMLDDTWGSEWFRANLPVKLLREYRGFRHDSGCPFEYGEAVIALYERHGIDPRSRIIIFSDGLNPQKMIDILDRFRGRIQVAFGIGTNLTNDLGLIKAWSLVMKIIEAAGNPAVKLSNNLNKATGDLDAVVYQKGVFGYTNTAAEAVVY